MIKQNVSGVAKQESWNKASSYFIWLCMETFKRHTVALEDQTMRDQINCLINFAADNSYALEIRHHHKCWLKYVRNYQRMSEDDKLPYLHNVIPFVKLKLSFFSLTTFGQLYLMKDLYKAFFETMALLIFNKLWFSYIWSEVVLHQRNPDQGVWEQNRILLAPSEEPRWVSLWYIRKWFICWSSAFSHWY